MAEQATGDLRSNKSKYLHSFEANANATHNESSYLTDDDSREFKFTYPLLMESQIRRFKQSMEPFKEIALPARSVLLWEKHWHPTAIIGGSTIFFTLLWLMDPSVLTLFSTLGLCLTLAEYLISSISSLFKSTEWNSEREQAFDDLCTDIVLFKVKTELAVASYYKMRTTNRKMYFTVTTLTLVFLAWIGCTFNNLCLSYVFVTFVLLLPGLEHHGMVSKVSEALKGCLFECVSKNKVVRDKSD